MCRWMVHIAVSLLCIGAAQESRPGDSYEPSLPYLPEGALRLLEGAPFPHEAPVVCAALSPDAETLVSLDSAGFVTGWERSTTKRLYRRQMMDPAWERRRLSCSPDGRWVALSSTVPGAPAVLVFETATGDEVCRIEPCTGAAFTRDGTIVAGWHGRRIRRWELETGRELPRLEESDRVLVAGTFSREGKVFAGAVDGVYGPVLWNTASLRRIDPPMSDRSLSPPRPTDLAVSPDGRTLAIGTPWDVSLWDLTGTRALFRDSMEAFGGPPLRFTSDGRRLIGGMRPKRLGLWNLASRSLDSSWVYPSTFYGFFEVSDAGDLLIRAVGAGITVERITSAGGEEESIRSPRGVSCVAFSGDGRAITCDSEGRVTRWDAASGKKLGCVALPPGRPLSVSRDGTRAAFEAPDHTLHVRDLGDGKRLMETRYIGQSDSAVLSPDGKDLLMGTEWGQVSLWNLAEGKQRHRLRDGSVAVTAVSWSRDGKSFAWGDAAGALVIASADTGQEEMRYAPRGRPVLALAFSPDGNTVATGDHAGEIRLWDNVLGREPTLLGKREEPVTTLAYSPDGRRIASGHRGGDLLLWRARPGSRPHEFGRQRATLLSIAFSPDGTLLLSGSDAPAALVWKVPPEK